MASLEQLIANARQLSRKERAQLAREMLRSLDEPDDGAPEEGVEEAWAVEIARRARAVEDGTAVLEDWADVRQRIRARLHDDQ